MDSVPSEKTKRMKRVVAKFLSPWCLQGFIVVFLYPRSFGDMIQYEYRVPGSPKLRMVSWIYHGCYSRRYRSMSSSENMNCLIPRAGIYMKKYIIMAGQPTHPLGKPPRNKALLRAYKPLFPTHWICLLGTDLPRVFEEEIIEDHRWLPKGK